MKLKDNHYFYISILIVTIIGTIFLAICEILKIDYMIFGKCLINEIFGIYCPACGGTRAFIELRNGNILKSLYYNPFLIYLIITVLIYLVLETINLLTKKDKFNTIKIVKIFSYIGILIMIINFLLRNILLIFDIRI